MCACLGFLMTDPVISQRWSAWKRALFRLYLKIQSWQVLFPGVEVELFRAASTSNSTSPEGLASRRRRPEVSTSQRAVSRARRMGACMSANGTIYVIKTKHERSRDLVANFRKPPKSRRKDSKKLMEAVMNGDHSHETLHRNCTNGGSNIVSLFTKQGRKGINQDAMLVWEDFGSRADTIFCGVFDGHGPQGHLVAQNVRDSLPVKLMSCWQALNGALKEPAFSSEGRGVDGINPKEAGCGGNSTGDPQLITVWKESFLNAYKAMDRELLGQDNVDCFSSGTTAVTLVKQGNHMIIGNVGDSRAVLATRADDSSLLAIQLTVDLKPDLPQEAERIRRCKGRVFALHDEPSVQRVWLPYDNSPGLAMARALGDFCLKNFGVISVPKVTYRRLRKKDQFIVLATDGVWDVLSNEQVVEIVSSVPGRHLAAKVVVDTAVHLWRSRYPTSKVDDCAVVCLFLDNFGTASHDSGSQQGKDASQSKKQSSHGVSQSLSQVGTGRQSDTHNGCKTENTSSQNVTTSDTDDKGDSPTESMKVVGLEAEQEEWSALQGVTRVNTLVNLPRFAPGTERAGD